MLGARIAQRRQIEPRKEMLAAAQQVRRDRHVHFVDEPRLEILAHRGRPAADLDMAAGPSARTPRETHAYRDSSRAGPHVRWRVGARGPAGGGRRTRRASSRSCGRAVWTWNPALVSYASNGQSRTRQAKDWSVT